ncbi:hypothetical protein RRG08_058384 [Elysia crispata]|uniref:Uncharacterized protein n=1 Tax=Elysia crispata TaxID=231223 RepID=A0AAE1CNV6_9GAST|nr:hypothetical protein RRG08_058384 [Elysia crispata]
MADLHRPASPPRPQCTAAVNLTNQAMRKDSVCIELQVRQLLLHEWPNITSSFTGGLKRTVEKSVACSSHLVDVDMADLHRPASPPRPQCTAAVNLTNQASFLASYDDCVAIHTASRDSGHHLDAFSGPHSTPFTILKMAMRPLCHLLHVSCNHLVVVDMAELGWLTSPPQLDCASDKAGIAEEETCTLQVVGRVTSLSCKISNFCRSTHLLLMIFSGIVGRFFSLMSRDTTVSTNYNKNITTIHQERIVHPCLSIFERAIL